MTTICSLNFYSTSCLECQKFIFILLAFEKVWLLKVAVSENEDENSGKPSTKKSMDTFHTPLAPPSRVYRRLGGLFPKSAYQQLATIGEKNV